MVGVRGKFVGLIGGSGCVGVYCNLFMRESTWLMITLYEVRAALNLLCGDVMVLMTVLVRWCLNVGSDVGLGALMVSTVGGLI